MLKSVSMLALVLLADCSGMIAKGGAQSVGELPPVTVEAGDVASLTVPYTGDSVAVVAGSDGFRVIREQTDDPAVCSLAIVGRKVGKYDLYVVVAGIKAGKAVQVKAKGSVTVTGPPAPPPPPGPGPDGPPPIPDNPPPGSKKTADDFRLSPDVAAKIARLASALPQGSRDKLADAHRATVDRPSVVIPSRKAYLSAYTEELAACGVSVPDELARALSAAVGECLPAGDRPTVAEVLRLRGRLRAVADAIDR